jgi:GAF domain-containing protein
MDPNVAFAEIGQIRLGDNRLEDILKRIAGLAKRTVPGADEVSVTLVRDRGPHTAAYTGQLALTLDEWQYEGNQGPCLRAAAEQTVISVPDLAADRRWPQWAARAVETGALSSLSVGLPVQDKVTGALNVYATAAQAFDEDAMLLAQTFAGYAAVALANAYLHDTTAGLAEHMRRAMEHRAVIEQAKGIIMADRRCTADQAFAILNKLSQDTNRKLRDVAAALVTRSAEPDTAQAKARRMSGPRPSS